ncbi:WD40/YVTN/BNR-like repeat-containing protein, partial [candidate division KSB1 bacterium]
SWENVRPNVRGVPEATWVSRIETSHFDEGTAYLTFDGHRSDNFMTWVFKTTDYGRTWTNITNNLPNNQPVYVIIEDLKNPNLLFVGTEFAVYYSITGGRNWAKLNNNMPAVAFHDLVIHPRDGDLVAGTHGRGVWIMDDVTPLQQATEEVLASDGHLFQNRVHTRWLSINTGGSGGALYFRGENPPASAAINYYLGASAGGTVQFEISNITGNLKRTFSIEARPGINRLMWDLRFDSPESTGQQQQTGGRSSRGRGGPAAGPGDYLVKMTYKGQIYSGTITVRDDPNVSGSR